MTTAQVGSVEVATSTFGRQTSDEWFTLCVPNTRAGGQEERPFYGHGARDAPCSSQSLDRTSARLKLFNR